MSLALMIKKPRHKSTGFTLIEILVALAVFSIMSLMAYKGLERMNTIKMHLDQEMRFWRELSLVMGRMDADFTQLSSRYQRDENQLMQAPIVSKQRDGATVIEFLRLDGHRESLHMAYVWKNEALQLEIWPSTSHSEAGETVQVHDLLNEVQSFSVEFLNTQNTWVTTWPPADAEVVRPRGIRFKLGFKDRGVFERVVALP